MKFFVTCPRYLENLLTKELMQLDIQEIEASRQGIFFQGDLRKAYQVCLWSRIANRVLLHLTSFAADDATALYQGISQIDWSTHLNSKMSFVVHAIGTTPNLRNSHFSALKVKDAIVDQFRSQTNQRPTVDSENPDIGITIHIQQKNVAVYIALTKTSLHQRKYRTHQTTAPLKENLAAGILYAAGWPEIAKKGGSFIDPMCGSGTFLIEAAQIASDIAPALQNFAHTLNHWLGHDANLWNESVHDALEKKSVGLKNFKNKIIGYEVDRKTYQLALEHIHIADLESHIQIEHRELADWNYAEDLKPGLIVTNPPYGERLGEKTNLAKLYRELGEFARAHQGWKIGILSADDELLASTQLKINKTLRFLNGKIPCKLALSHIASSIKMATTPLKFSPEIISELTAEIIPFANRIIKNFKHLSNWAIQEHLDAYRIYDRDLPDYALAIDRYGDYLHVQEYAAPKFIDPMKTKLRLESAVNVLQQLFNIPKNQIIIKQRHKQQRFLQYQKLADRNDFFEIHEDKAKFLVNLHDYLDTGLFLDHRPIRSHIAKLVKNKRFLNLFCYTATASIQAALHGAKSTTSVDLSKTYLHWAKKNFALNKIAGQHEIVESDVMTWLKNSHAIFDLILLDPPTFSNSKKNREDFDIQRDQLKIIELTMQHLHQEGILIFSTHGESFKLDENALEKFIIKNVTAKMIAADFKRHSGAHQCWEISHKPR